MPNKNIKKRRRVVTTSDIVPAGSRDEVISPGATDDSEVLGAFQTSEPAAPGPGSSDASGESKDDAGEAVSASHVSASQDDAVATTAADGGDGDGAAARDDVATTAADGGDGDGADARGGEVFSKDRTSADDGASVEIAATGATGDAALAADANDDDPTEPAAQGDELWAPEEPEPAAVTLPAADLSRAHLKGLIEALVFVSDQPLSINEIAKAGGRADRKLVRALADELRQDYARRGIHLDEVAGGLIFRTNPAYGPFIRDAAAKKPVKMTRAQLETLAIIAYRQPLTRPEVDEVRGVDSGPVMKMLLERDLIKILGKKDEPGRPLLYGTTHVFLEFFGLKALKDLPSLREFTELSDDSRRVFDREMADSPDAPTDPNLANLAAAASAAGPAPTPSTDSLENDPSMMRPADGAPTDWFDRPTEPDTTVDGAAASEAAIATEDRADSAEASEEDGAAEASDDDEASEEDGAAEASDDDEASEEDGAAQASEETASEEDDVTSDSDPGEPGAQA